MTATDQDPPPSVQSVITYSAVSLLWLLLLLSACLVEEIDNCMVMRMAIRCPVGKAEAGEASNVSLISDDVGSRRHRDV